MLTMTGFVHEVPFLSWRRNPGPGLERRGRIHTALSWKESRRNSFDVGQRVRWEGI